jgi:hypothetical protein
MSFDIPNGILRIQQNAQRHGYAVARICGNPDP